MWPSFDVQPEKAVAVYNLSFKCIEVCAIRLGPSLSSIGCLYPKCDALHHVHTLLTESSTPVDNISGLGHAHEDMSNIKTCTSGKWKTCESAIHVPLGLDSLSMPLQRQGWPSMISLCIGVARSALSSTSLVQPSCLSLVATVVQFYSSSADRPDKCGRS